MASALKVEVVLSAIDNITSKLDQIVAKTTTKLQAMSSRSMEIGRSALGVGVGVGAALAVPIKAATEFETGMTNVRKVVDGLRDETAFKDFSAQVLALGRELPLAYNEITDMVAASGRMGVAKEDLIAYTREVGKMAMAFDMSAGEVGKSMGKISNVFKIPKKDITQLADAINTLDDATTAEGRDIIDVMLRAGGTANMLKMPATQLAALGTTFLELGDSPEIAATAIQAFFAKLGTASVGDKKFQSALTMLGLNPKQIQKDMADGKAQEVINTVMESLRTKVKSEDQIVVATQLFGMEYFKSATKLAAGIDTYKKAMDEVQAKGADGKVKYQGSMQREYEARMKTTAAQAAIFKNNISEIAITLGTAMLPALNEVMRALKPYIDSFRDWAARNPELIAQIAKVAAVLAATSLATSGLSFVFGGLFKTLEFGVGMFNAVRKGIGLIGGGFKLIMKIGGLVTGVLGGVVKAFGFVGTALRAVTAAFMTNPIGLAIAAIATAVYLIYEYWTPLKEFFVNLWGGIKDVFGNVWGWLKDMAGAFYEAGKNLLVYLWEGMKSMFSRVKDGFIGFIRGDLVGAVEGLTGGAVQQALELKRQEALIAAGQPVTGGGFAGFAAATMGKANIPTPVAANSNTTNNQTVNFSPVINVQGMGGVEGFGAAMDKAKQDLARQMKEIQEQQTRKAFK